jgi:hypothetical protein
MMPPAAAHHTSHHPPTAQTSFTSNLHAQQQPPCMALPTLPSFGALLLPASLRRGALDVDTYVASLAPLGETYRHLLCGERAHAAARTHGWGFLSAAMLSELAVGRANLGAASGAFAAMARAVRAWQRPSGTATMMTQQQGGGDDAHGGVFDRPAWMVLAGRQLPAESLCVQLATVCGASARATRARMVSAPPPPSPGALTPAELVWLADSHRAQMTALQATTQASVLLRDLQMAPAHEFVRAASAVLDACASICAAGADGVEARAAWVRQLLLCSESAKSVIGTASADAGVDNTATMMVTDVPAPPLPAQPIYTAPRFVIHLPPHPEDVVFD